MVFLSFTFAEPVLDPVRACCVTRVLLQVNKPGWTAACTKGSTRKACGTAQVRREGEETEISRARQDEG